MIGNVFGKIKLHEVKKKKCQRQHLNSNLSQAPRDNSAERTDKKLPGCAALTSCIVLRVSKHLHEETY